VNVKANTRFDSSKASRSGPTKDNAIPCSNRWKAGKVASALRMTSGRPLRESELRTTSRNAAKANKLISYNQERSGGYAMSTFERDDFKWRETYFVLFYSCKRPTLADVKRVLADLHDHFEFTGGTSDEDGRFESLTVLAPDDYAALDISFVSGEEVQEQGATFYAEMKSTAADADERKKIARLRQFDSRFDLLHFEQMSSAGADEGLDEMLDPSALLLVLEALVELTEGVGVDPQAGTVL